MKKSILITDYVFASVDLALKRHLPHLKTKLDRSLVDNLIVILRDLNHRTYHIEHGINMETKDFDRSEAVPLDKLTLVKFCIKIHNNIKLELIKEVEGIRTDQDLAFEMFVMIKTNITEDFVLNMPDA